MIEVSLKCIIIVNFLLFIKTLKLKNKIHFSQKGWGLDHSEFKDIKWKESMRR